MSTSKRGKAATATNGHTLTRKSSNISIAQGRGLTELAARLADVEGPCTPFRTKQSIPLACSPDARPSGVYTPSKSRHPRMRQLRQRRAAQNARSDRRAAGADPPVRAENPGRDLVSRPGLRGSNSPSTFRNWMRSRRASKTRICATASAYFGTRWRPSFAASCMERARRALS